MDVEGDGDSGSGRSGASRVSVIFHRITNLYHNDYGIVIVCTG